MKNKFYKYLLSVIIFSFAALAMHKYFFDGSSEMTLRGTDSTKQFLYFKYLLYELYKNGDFFWSWSYGLGGDIFAQFNYYYSLSLFYLITFFFDFDTLFSIIESNLVQSIIKHFCAMLALFIYLRFHKRSYLASIIGGLIYGGSFALATYSLTFDYMVDYFVLLPVVILAFDYYVERKKPVPFIILLVLIIATNFYFAFITTLYLIFYAIFKYFDLENRKRSIRDFGEYTLSISIYYLLAMGISAFSFLPSVYQFFQSDRLEKDYAIPLLFDLNYYVQLVKLLFLAFHSHHSLGLTVFGLILLIFGWTIRSKQLLPKQIFLGIMILLTCIPFMYSLFNGLSAMQPRWLYLVSFTFCFIIAYFFDELTKRKYKRLYLSFVVLILLFFYMQWQWGFRPVNVITYEKRIFLAGTISVISFILYCLSKKTRIVWSALLIMSIIYNGMIYHYHYYAATLGPALAQKELQEQFFNSVSLENAEALEVSEELKKFDTDFGRTIWDPLMNYNQNMYYGYKSHSAYHSLIPRNIHQFFKEDYNIFHRNIMSYYDHYDHRLYLETAMNNQFYVSQKNIGYIPYGYSKIFETDNWTVFANDNKLPIGFLYTDWLSKKTFDSLNVAQKDQAFMKAVVLEDKSIAPIPSRFNTDSLTVVSNRIDLDNLQLIEMDLEGENIFVSHTDDRSYIRIPIDRLQKSGEYLVELDIREINDANFSMKVGNKKIEYYGSKNIWSYPKEDIMFNAGWNIRENYIDVYLSKGKYAIENIRVLHNSYENYAKDVEKLKTNSIQNVQYTENSVSGTIQSTEDGIFFLSIPYSKGWEAELNGKKIDLYEVNHAFIGFPLEEGNYELELTYVSPFFKEGSIISITMLLITIVYVSKRKKRSV